MTEMALMVWMALIGFAVLGPLWVGSHPLGSGAMAFPGLGVAAYAWLCCRS